MYESVRHNGFPLASAPPYICEAKANVRGVQEFLLYLLLCKWLCYNHFDSPSSQIILQKILNTPIPYPNKKNPNL